jgi:hypothetical protein
LNSQLYVRRAVLIAFIASVGSVKDLSLLPPNRGNIIMTWTLTAAGRAGNHETEAPAMYRAEHTGMVSKSELDFRFRPGYNPGDKRKR